MLYLPIIIAALLSVVASVPSTSPSTLPNPDVNICIEPPGGITVSTTTPNVNFTTSKWIWTSEEAQDPNHSAPVGSRVFRKDFIPPALKFPVCATILMAADNSFVLFVNGVQVSSGNSFTNAVVTTSALTWFSSNTFAVIATNAPGGPSNPAGLIGTIMITYSDGSHEFIVTDATWKTFLGGVPPGATDPNTDDSSWPFAVVQGTDGSLPFWPKVVLPFAFNGAFQTSNWIWANEGNPRVSAPAESRGFRRTINAGNTKCGLCAQAIISTDNAYTLFMNGNAVGAGSDWTIVQYLTITGLNGTSEVFAINGTNTLESPAGLIASILVAYDDGSTTITQTDSSWKALTGTSPPAGFQAPGFDDSSWPGALVEGAYGVQPWGNITVPQA